MTVSDDRLAAHERRAYEYRERWPKGGTTPVWTDDLLDMIAEIMEHRREAGKIG